MGCSGGKGQFVEGRVLDRCGETWPVCSQIAGCLLGGESYLEGRLPGEVRFIVQVPEPSKVRVSLYIEDASAAGEETALHFYEDRCRSRVREAVSGRAFLGEAEQFGEFTREALLTGLGDHLVELISDAQVRYALKVEVNPTRGIE
jgi:hypothetical protein